MDDSIYNELKHNWKSIQNSENLFLESGYLTERVDDERFDYYVNSIMNDIIERWQKSPKINQLYFPEFDLYILLKYNPNSPEIGFFTRTQKDKTPIIVINITEQSKEDYDNKNFIKLLSDYKRALKHEVVHYVNYISSKNKALINYKVETEYNNPQEFNAYYHQIRDLFVKRLKEVIELQPNYSENLFDVVFGDTSQKFIAIFYEVIKKENKELFYDIKKSEKYKVKWLTRIYQLYFELMEEYNKNKIDLDSLN